MTTTLTLTNDTLELTVTGPEPEPSNVHRFVPITRYTIHLAPAAAPALTLVSVHARYTHSSNVIAVAGAFITELMDALTSDDNDTIDTSRISNCNAVVRALNAMLNDLPRTAPVLYPIEYTNTESA